MFIDQYITAGLFLVVSTVMLVSALDKIFTETVPYVKANRGWILPTASLILGIVVFWLYAESQRLDANIFQIIFSGMNVGAFATASFKIIREAFVKKLASKLDVDHE